MSRSEFVGRRRISREIYVTIDKMELIIDSDRWVCPSHGTLVGVSSYGRWWRYLHIGLSRHI